MVELNHRQRTIKIKIVYYGPPVGGKTTNLQVLHQHADAQRRGELVSINSAQDRTILFDLLPLKVPGFRGFDLRLQVLTVPGQAMYAATRRLVLKGADSVVFVANSAADRFEENVQSFREMTENLLLHQLDPASMPMVLQYNKRDLPTTTAINFMDRTLNARKVDALPAVAITGQGVLETFAAVLSRTVNDLAVRYQIVDVGRGQGLANWTRQAMLGMFGATSLTEEAPLWENAAGEPLAVTDEPPKKLTVAPAPLPPQAPAAPVTPARAESAEKPPAPAPTAAPRPASPEIPLTAYAAPATATPAPPAEVRPAAPAAAPAVTAPARGPMAIPAVPAVTAPARAPMPIPAVPAVTAPARAPMAIPAVPVLTPVAPPPETVPAPPRPAPLPPPTPRAAALKPFFPVPNDRTVLRLDPVREALHLDPQARAGETLVESYAQAASRLTSDMADLREERNLAQRRLDDLRQALLAAQDIVAGQPLETTLKSVLGQMADAAGARHASLLVPRADGSFQAALKRALEQDPLLRMPRGVRHVTDQFKSEAEPRLHDAADSLDLGDALTGSTPAFDFLVAVPLRTTHGLQALAMLYYTADDVRPEPSILEHLGLIAGTLSSALEMASATAALQQDVQFRELAVVGTTAMRGLEDVLAPLLLFRDRMGVLRRRPDAPDWLQKECDRLIPTLSRALGQARSLLGFGRGDLQRERVEAEALLADQLAQGMQTETPAGLAVLGDPALLRLALGALVERARDAGKGTVRARLDSAQRRVRIRIGPGVEPGFRGEPGLAFVHKVLELHKSELSTETDAEGTWFSFRIDQA